MESFLRRVQKANFYLKILLVTNCIAILFWGSSLAAVLVFILGFTALILIHRNWEYSPSPILILCFLLIIVGITIITSGTYEEVWMSLIFGARLLGIIVITSVAGASISVGEIVNLCNMVRLPRALILLISILVRTVPVSIESLRSVVLAQQSRGLRFTVMSFLKIGTYEAILVPYTISVLRLAFLLWISNLLRPPTNIHYSFARPSMAGIFILLFSLFFWYV